MQACEMRRGGESIVLDFYDNTVNVLINGEKTDSVNGNDFQRAALAIWLGSNPPNDELKVGILGS